MCDQLFSTHQRQSIHGVTTANTLILSLFCVYKCIHAHSSRICTVCTSVCVCARVLCVQAIYQVSLFVLKDLLYKFVLKD